MKYPEIERANVIDKHIRGLSAPEISLETGISRSTVYEWIKNFRDLNNSDITPYDKSKEIKTLIRQNARLKDMVTILKTVDCTVSSPLREKLDAIESLHGKFSVHVLCDALEVARGTFYNHTLRNKRGNTMSAKLRSELRILINDIFHESNQILGARKIRAVLADRGYRVSDKTVTELMREMDLYSVRTSSKQDYLRWQKGENKNVLQQNFHANNPNQVWVSDVTVFKLKSRLYYICVVIDLYSRKIVAYKISCKNSTQLITKTFKAAYNSRMPERGMIFHSDRGSQYLSFTFRSLLETLGIIQSLSRAGKPCDNAVSESFFASLKKEELYRRKYTSEKDFFRGIENYMSFYNEKRPHISLHYKTPEKMELNVAN